MNLAFENWPISRLVGYARNPRKNDHVVDRIVASIREYGFAVPILAKSDGTVIDGHLRLKGATKLGITELPVIVVDGWTEAQIKSFRLLANRSVNWAEWDEELLALEFEEIGSLDLDLVLTGFDAAEIEKLSGTVAPDGWKENWKEMPEFHQEDLEAAYSIKVNFSSATDRDMFAQLIGQTISEKTRSIWYPQAEIGRIADKRYVSSE